MSAYRQYGEEMARVLRCEQRAIDCMEVAAREPVGTRYRRGLQRYALDWATAAELWRASALQKLAGAP